MHLKSQFTGAEATLPRLTDDFFCPSYKIIYVYWKSGFARTTPESDFEAFFNKKKFKSLISDFRDMSCKVFEISMNFKRDKHNWKKFAQFSIFEFGAKKDRKWKLMIHWF